MPPHDVAFNCGPPLCAGCGGFCIVVFYSIDASASQVHFDKILIDPATVTGFNPAYTAGKNRICLTRPMAMML